MATTRQGHYIDLTRPIQLARVMVLLTVIGVLLSDFIGV